MRDALSGDRDNELNAKDEVISNANNKKNVWMMISVLLLLYLGRKHITTLRSESM